MTENNAFPPLWLPKALLATIPFMLALVLVGCAEGPTKIDPAVLKSLQANWVLDGEPEGAITPLDWRDEQEASSEIEAAEAPSSESATLEEQVPADDPTNDQVVLIGKVGGMPNPWPDQYPEFPWVANEATFFLVDPSTVAEFEAHTGDMSTEEAEAHAADCPFCAREAANQSKAVAAISFVDEEGNPTKADIRELFGIAKGDVVVVKGQSSLIGDLLYIEADGLFQRK